MYLIGKPCYILSKTKLLYAFQDESIKKYSNETFIYDNEKKIKRVSDGKYLFFSNNKCIFSEKEHSIVILIKTKKHNVYKIVVNNKFVCYNKNDELALGYNSVSCDWTFIVNEQNDDSRYIVSRYNEDVEWTKYLQGNVIIYNKGKNDLFLPYKHINIINLQNIGREGHTYLHHIITNYSNLSSYTYFLQGNPFEHCNDLLELMTLDPLLDLDACNPLSIKYSDTIPPKNVVLNNSHSILGLEYGLYDITNNCQLVDFTNDHGLNFLIQPYLTENHLLDHENLTIPHFLKKCGLEHYVRPKYKFFYSAIFKVNKSNVLKNSKESYQNILDVLLSKNNQGGSEGYILERLWYTIFT